SEFFGREEDLHQPCEKSTSASMDTLFKVDWHSMFVPTESLIEIFIRGTVMYLGMFLLLRFFRRQAGAVGTADLLLIVVIADAAQNGMAGDSKSITEAALLIITIVGWNYFLDFLTDRSAFFKRLLEPQDLLLIQDGKLLRHNMHKEMITFDELVSQLRQQGVEKVSEVKQCRLESNGHFSVLKKDSNSGGASENHPAPQGVH
ncbi:MAG: YetF domain-containing protein, partial [Verrucomicrobiota bacterium]